MSKLVSLYVYLIYLYSLPQVLIAFNQILNIVFSCLFGDDIMWSFASNAIAGSLKKKAQPSKCSISNADYSDDEVSSCTSREEGLDCPICWESFNLVENVPYVLWCGHTMCKNCILGLHWAVVKFPSLPIQLPLFISCPWCNLLSFRLVYKGNLRFPRKNYFLLWIGRDGNLTTAQ